MEQSNRSVQIAITLMRMALTLLAEAGEAKATAHLRRAIQAASTPGEGGSGRAEPA